ncbi:cocaine esterase-like isoform X2 [Palaemon carinicauda]
MTVSVWICIVIAVHLGSASGSNEGPVISTEGGQVSGVVEEATQGKLFYSYYGIPFAEPPLGDLRFKDPIASKGWSGIRDGSKMPSPCINIPFGLMVHGIKIPAEQVPGKEDCLYLNVFMPTTAASVGTKKTGKALPVMVYIHGGGFFGGAAEEYLPHVLMNKDVVLVVTQYRVGFLGFLSTEDSVIPGNFGLKDQTLALQWVQRNIHSFGGDPEKVTIFGESAGGASVHYQMLTPKAKGLFTGVIMQSGTALAPWASISDHRKVAAEVGASVGCNLDRGSEVFLKCLQSANGQNININSQDLLEWFLMPNVAVPRVDGDFIPDHPAKLMKEGRYNKVNLMAGITANEGACLTQPMYNTHRYLLEELKRNLTYVGPVSLSLNDKESLSYTKHILNYYLGGANFDTPYEEEYTQMMSDIHFNFDHDIVTLHHSREKGVSTFRYEMAHRGQMSFGDFSNPKIGRHWVPHADDLLYLFRGGPTLTPPNQPAERPTDLTTDEDLLVRDIMVTMWTNFATHGHPTPDDSLGFRWDAATEDDFRHLEISVTPSMKRDPRAEARRFFLSIPTKKNLILNPNLLTPGDPEVGDESYERDETKQEEEKLDRSVPECTFTDKFLTEFD